MSSKLAILALFAARLIAQPGQCYVGGTSASCPCDGAQTPCVQSFIAGATSSLATMTAAMSALPQPKIVVGGQFVPASATWITADSNTCYTPVNTCVFAKASALNSYNDTALKGAGVGCVDWNYYPDPYIEAAEYAGSATPAAPVWQTYLLTVYDSIALHIKANGQCLRMSGSPLSTTWAACGIPDASVMTEATQAACLNPIYAATVAHLTGLGVTVSDFTPNHEPTGFWLLVTGQTFSTADWSAYVASAATAIHAAAGGSAIKIGSGVTAGDIPSYSDYLVANNSGSMDFLGIDAYGPKLSSGYASTFSTVYGAACQAAVAAGFACKFQEWDEPRHIPSAAAGAGEQYAYEGCGWDSGTAGWQTWGLNNAYAALMPRWASAMGATYFSRYPTGANAAFQPDSTLANCNSNNPTTSYLAYVMAHLGSTTTAGLGYKAGGTWSAITWQGFISLSGRVTIQ